MSTLTLQLAGPLQSWGSTSRFTRRTTEDAPTKSGVIGLLAAALGLERDADLTHLAALRFGVRIDQPGVRLRDFQTAHDFDTGDAMPLSERFYLADAVFVAAVEGEPRLLQSLEQALKTPAFLPYLGRRSCPPAREIALEIREGMGIEEALKAEPWRASAWHQRARRTEPTVALDTLVEPSPDDAGAFARSNSLRDQPRSFAPANRRYALRAVVRDQVDGITNPSADPATPNRRGEVQHLPLHDPTSGLEEA